MASTGRTVKELLKLIRHYSSVAIDMALYALYSGDKSIALETLKIERKVDDYVRELISRVSLAIRDPDDAGLAVGIAEVGRALDKVTDAAGDLAGLVLRGYPVHDYIRHIINCCGDLVLLLHSKKSLRDLPSIVDLLLVKRGETYLVAPELTKIEKGDLVVVRGTFDEIQELARAVGDTDAVESIRASTVTNNIPGEELASRLLRIKTLARLALDLAFHSIIYGDQSVASLVGEMEDTVDSLYHEILEYSYYESNPSIAREMVSIAIFDTAMETIADAAMQLSNIVKRIDEYSILISEALEEAEEVYLKLRVTGKLDGKRLGDLGLADLGLSVIAIGKNGGWIVPVTPDRVLEEGDIVLAKYYRPENEDKEERIEDILEQMGFEIEED